MDNPFVKEEREGSATSLVDSGIQQESFCGDETIEHYFPYMESDNIVEIATAAAATDNSEENTTEKHKIAETEEQKETTASNDEAINNETGHNSADGQCLFSNVDTSQFQLEKIEVKLKAGPIELDSAAAENAVFAPSPANAKSAESPPKVVKRRGRKPVHSLEERQRRVDINRIRNYGQNRLEETLQSEAIKGTVERQLEAIRIEQENLLSKYSSEPTQLFLPNEKAFLPEEYLDDDLWLPTIHLNIGCFTGPYLSKGKLRALAQHFGPGALPHMLRLLLKNILQCAHRTHEMHARLRADKTSECQQMMLKVKSNSTKRLNVEICDDALEFPLWMIKLLLRLDACPNLISLEKQAECPLNCSKRIVAHHTRAKEAAKTGTIKPRESLREKQQLKRIGGENSSTEMGIESKRKKKHNEEDLVELSQQKMKTRGALRNEAVPAVRPKVKEREKNQQAEKDDFSREKNQKPAESCAPALVDPETEVSQESQSSTATESSSSTDSGGSSSSALTSTSQGSTTAVEGHHQHSNHSNSTSSGGSSSSATTIVVVENESVANSRNAAASSTPAPTPKTRRPFAFTVVERKVMEKGSSSAGPAKVKKSMEKLNKSAFASVVTTKRPIISKLSEADQQQQLGLGEKRKHLAEEGKMVKVCPRMQQHQQQQQQQHVQNAAFARQSPSQMQQSTPTASLAAPRTFFSHPTAVAAAALRQSPFSFLAATGGYNNHFNNMPVPMPGAHPFQSSQPHNQQLDMSSMAAAAAYGPAYYNTHQQQFFDHQQAHPAMFAAYQFGGSSSSMFGGGGHQPPQFGISGGMGMPMGQMMNQQQQQQQPRIAHPPITSNPKNWTCSELAEWIAKAGYPTVADRLREEEVDGTSLMLFTVSHFQNMMGLKLGPAVKMADLVETLKAHAHAFGSEVAKNNGGGGPEDSTAQPRL